MTDRLTLSLPVGALERLEATVRAAGVRGAWRVARRSLDARRGRDPRWVLALDIAEPGEELPAFTRAPSPREPRRRSPPVLVAGAGPAGLFAATALAEAGVPVEVLDRGEGFPARHFQARDLRLHGVFNPESNLRFGLGGAGTYSDGKLFTRKRGPRVEEVLARLAWLAGDEDLVVEAHPHVGTNRLIPLLERLRRALEDAGVRFRFGVRAEGLLLREGRVCGLRTTAGDLEAAAVILAPGNAARDTFAWLHRAGVALVSRPFAVGVRVEHPRALIDAIQYGAFAGHPELGAAEYRLAFPAGERGVFSFCMCPGGHVLPVPAEPGGLAVNGASHAARGSPFSNAALVVTTGPGDWGGGDDPL
ncbi:MAG: FAD-dependent monooxygenase, partial [Deltaproteobacteria bacterium]|nr:FAD-dependent monooxygenase [Deltaproteobacteria bacterium]